MSAARLVVRPLLSLCPLAAAAALPSHTARRHLCTGRDAGAKKAAGEGLDVDQHAVVRAGDLFERFDERQRNKRAFEHALGTFLHKNVQRRGHVEFIQTALGYLKEFGVHRQLDTYKKLIDIFPKGKYVPQNQFQLAGRHFPKHNQACVRVLDMMDYNGVVADKELYDMVINTFGEWAEASMKIKRSMFWMVKFKHTNPFRMPRVAPDSALQRAKLAMAAMCRDPATKIDVFTMESYSEKEHDAWVVSGQSPMQRQHIDTLSSSDTLYVDGPERVYVTGAPVLYYQLSAAVADHVVFHDFTDDDPTSAVNDEEWTRWQSRYTLAGRRRHRRPDAKRTTDSGGHEPSTSATPSVRQRAPLSVHEQADGVLLALCVPGQAYSNAQLAHWLHCLQRASPALESQSVVFRMRSNLVDALTRDVVVKKGQASA